MSTFVIKRTKNSIHKYGVTILLDGMDNANSPPLLNIMFICSNKDLFLKAIDTIGDWKDAYNTYAMPWYNIFKKWVWTMKWKYVRITVPTYKVC
jgi:hypothetical protein